MVRNSTIANNNNDGLITSGGADANIEITRSTIYANLGNGWTGNVKSYVDNNIYSNAAGNSAPPTTGYE